MDLREVAINKNRLVIEIKCGIRSECSICMEEMFLKKVYHCPCGHTFHSHCLLKWRTIKNNCPLCRQNFVVNTSEISHWFDFAYMLSVMFTDYDLEAMFDTDYELESMFNTDYDLEVFNGL